MEDTPKSAQNPSHGGVSYLVPICRSVAFDASYSLPVPANLTFLTQFTSGESKLEQRGAQWFCQRATAPRKRIQS